MNTSISESLGRMPRYSVASEISSVWKRAGISRAVAKKTLPILWLLNGGADGLPGQRELFAKVIMSSGDSRTASNVLFLCKVVVSSLHSRGSNEAMTSLCRNY